MSNNVFVTPILPVSDIIAVLKETETVKISLTENDFQRPDTNPFLLGISDICVVDQKTVRNGQNTHFEPRRWMEVYLCLYNALTSRSLEEASQLFCVYGNFKASHAELHEEGLSQVGFALCMQRLLATCGFQDFSVHDIIMPSRKRLIRIMSSAINKMRHDAFRHEVFEAIEDRCVQSKEERDRVMNLNKELRQQFETMKESNVQIEKEIKECKLESEGLMSQIAEFRRQRDVDQRNLDELKLNNSEKTALKEKLKTEKNYLQQEHDKLSQKIVHSPDRFKQDQERLKKKVLELKELNDVKLNKLSTEKAITEQTANNRVASEKVVRLIKEVLSDFEKANELLAEMDDCNENLRERQEELTALYAECDDVKENIAIRQGQKHTLTHQLDLKKQCTQQQKVDVQRNHEIYQEKLDSIKLQDEQIKKKISESRQKILSLENQNDKATKEWHQELSGIYQELDILHNNIANGCKDFKALPS